MSKSRWLIVSLALCLLACNKAPDRASKKEAQETSQSLVEAVPKAKPAPAANVKQPPKAEKSLQRVDIGDSKTMWIVPLRHQNLTLLPITILADKADPTEYLTLDEGMKSKQVRISEMSDSGDVNTLRLRNRSEKPLFLLAGEVVIGGKQDRIIAKTLVIEAGERTTVPVFCVEQGRWNGRKADFSSAESIAHLKLRTVANYGSQGGVWSEVSDKNAARGESNGTDTYRAVATKKESVADYKRAIELAYKTGIVDHAIEGEPVVGFAIAYNGEIVGIESFGSPTLFAKLRPKLLHSYYVDAIDKEYDEERSSRPMAREAHSKGGIYKGRKSGRKQMNSAGYENKKSKTSSWKRGKIQSTEVRIKSKKRKPGMAASGVEADSGADSDSEEQDPLYDSTKM